MSKALKNTLIILLSALLLFSCAFPLLNLRLVYADELSSDTQQSSDDNFKIKNATLNTNAFATGRNVLSYGVTLKNTDLTNLSNRLAVTATNWAGYTVDVPSEVKFTFRLVRDKTDGNSETALVEYVLWFKGYGGRNGNRLFGKVLAKKDLSYYPEKVTFGDATNPVDEYTYKNAMAGTNNDAVINTLKKNNYEILSYGTTTEGFPVSDKSQTVPFIVETNDYITNYHVEFEHYEYMAEKTTDVWWFDHLGMHSETKAELEQEGQCVQYVLSDWRDSNKADFESTFGFYGADTLAKANNVIDEVETITVKVKYLEQIGDTPFAQARYKTVDVSVPFGKVTEEAMLAALDLESFKCLKSYGNKVIMDDLEKVWEIKYYHSSHLRAIASNGKYLDYFFDINDSYAEYYEKFIDEGHFTRECFEYVLNEIGNAYPELAKGDQQNLFDNGNDLYGLWGYVQIPEGINFDEAFKDIFNVKTTVGVQNVGFSYKSYLSADAYKKLVASQEFSKLEKWWSVAVADVAGGYEATTYVMVMEPGVNWIDHTGSVDNEDEAKDPDQGGTNQDFIGNIGSSINNAWNSFLGIFDGLTGSPLALGATAGVVLLGVVGYFLIKTGAFSSIGKNRQARPKHTKRSKKK